MPAFEYSAINVGGKTKRGVIEADSERHARKRLREQSLTPLKVVETNKQGGQRGQRGRSLFKEKFSAEQLALITRLLGTLLRSGLQ